MTTQTRSKIVHLYGEIREMWSRGMSEGLIAVQLEKQHPDISITRDMMVRAARTMKLQRRRNREEAA